MRHYFPYCLRRTVIDKIIVTVMLIMGGVVAAFAVFNGVYPAVQRSSAAINSASDTVNDRLKTQIEIIQVADNGTTVEVWIKNVGSTEIGSIPNSDVFFGPQDSFSRIAYGDVSSPLPYWNYQLEGNNSRWTAAVTNRIVLHLAAPPPPGTYMVDVIMPNGISDETAFSLE